VQACRTLAGRTGYRYRGDPRASVIITLGVEDGILFHVGNRGLSRVRRADGTPVDPAAEDPLPATIQLNETGEGIIVNDGDAVSRDGPDDYRCAEGISRSVTFPALKAIYETCSR
jgi:hypothetical protein